MTLRFLTAHEHALVTRIADILLPAHGQFPGAGAAGAGDYIDALLGAFTFEPPRIWAGGPFSGRHGGAAGFSDFTELSRLEVLAWQTRIEGSLGLAQREWNGPFVGWQSIYRDGLAQLDPRFLDLDARSQWRALGSIDELRQLLFEHACEATYGPPEYGGNRDLAGWTAIGYAGDVQPRGWTDAEVLGA